MIPDGLLTPTGVEGLCILQVSDGLLTPTGFGVLWVLLKLPDLFLPTGVEVARDHVDAELVLVFVLSEYLIGGLTEPVFLFLKYIILFNRCGVFEGVLHDVILLFSMGLNIGDSNIG